MKISKKLFEEVIRNPDHPLYMKVLHIWDGFIDIYCLKQ